MSRVIATNEIKEEFDGVLETPLANFPFDFDVSSEGAHELQTEEVHCSTSTGSNNSSFQLPSENEDQNTAKSDSTSDDSMTEGEEEDNATSQDRDDTKVKVVYLNCTQPDCVDKLDTFDLLHEHLHNKHGLLHLQCFCGCKSRFNNRMQLSRHLQDRSVSKFSCPVCTKVCSTQNKTYSHWYQNHLTGRFQCSIDDCSKVVETRHRLYSHQQHQHCPELKRHQCPHDGCSSSFVLNKDLKKHQMIHLNTKPFHCKWAKCVHHTNRHSDLIRHIRNVHFKKQQENAIGGERDPNKYVRVVKK